MASSDGQPVVRADEYDGWAACIGNTPHPQHFSAPRNGGTFSGNVQESVENQRPPLVMGPSSAADVPVTGEGSANPVVFTAARETACATMMWEAGDDGTNSRYDGMAVFSGEGKPVGSPPEIISSQNECQPRLTKRQRRNARKRISRYRFQSRQLLPAQQFFDANSMDNSATHATWLHKPQPKTDSGTGTSVGMGIEKGDYDVGSQCGSGNQVGSGRGDALSTEKHKMLNEDKSSAGHNLTNPPPPQDISNSARADPKLAHILKCQQTSDEQLEKVPLETISLVAPATTGVLGGHSTSATASLRSPDGLMYPQTSVPKLCDQKAQPEKDKIRARELALLQAARQSALISLSNVSASTSTGVGATQDIGPRNADTSTKCTIYINRMSPDLREEGRLRALFNCPIRGVKVRHGTERDTNTMRAWVTFYTSEVCTAQLAMLRRSRPELSVCLHDNGRNKSCGTPNALARYDAKFEGVVRNGGVGNTLMFINMPVEVSLEEFEVVVETTGVQTHLGEICGEAVRPMRTRSAVSKGGVSQNFWCVFADSNTARRVFQRIHESVVTFRCGRKITLCPFLHDDSQDVDETRRRKRALAINATSRDVRDIRRRFGQTEDGTANYATAASSVAGTNASAMGSQRYGLGGTGCAKNKLENFLRVTLKDFVFLDDSPNRDT